MGIFEFPKIKPSSGKNVKFLHIFATRGLNFKKFKNLVDEKFLNVIRHILVKFQVSSSNSKKVAVKLKRSGFETVRV